MTQAADIVRSKRVSLALPGGKHDRMVRVLSTLLPAGIGMLAAVMILAPLSPRGEISFLLDRNKVAIAEDRISVADAKYRGEDNHGRPFALSAASAVQAQASDPVVRMESLSAAIEMSDGPALLSAPGGLYNFDLQTVKIDGPVEFSAADGYRLTTRGVTVDLRDQRVTGTGGIEGAVPAGTFSAEEIVADLDERTVALVGRARLRMTQGKLRIP
ncbi:MAG: LPS export ABC transporter periplasmic protein LptC [Novosphingobium sp.]